MSYLFGSTHLGASLRDARGPMAVAVVSVAVTWSGLSNGFAYDDVGLIVNDTRLHSLETLPDRLAKPWWPTGLYRPVSLAWLAAQWVLGSGSPVVFRIVSTALYAAVSVAVFRLARQAGATTSAALAGAAVFAVHPVHSEVTANVVGQAEMLATLAALAALIWYVRARLAPAPSWWNWLGISLLFLISANAKEVGYVLPALFLVAEILVVPDPMPRPERTRALRPVAWLILATALASLLVRTRVLGALGGETPHHTLAGLSIGERAMAMLAVVPEWTRLLLWPARLQAEYGPPALQPVLTISGAHLLGLAILAGFVTALYWSWRRAPLVAAGLAWIAIALAPVANLVFPTGILLAERTLFLPSVGLALVVSGLAERWTPGLSMRPRVRQAVLIGFGLVLAAGAIRSGVRQPAWRSTMSILGVTALDAPNSYRAQMVYGRELSSQGMVDSAETVYRRAIALWDRDPRPFEELGQMLRVRGVCAEAIPVLQAGVRVDSTSDVARSRLVECLIVEHRWDEAEREIARGMAQGVSAYQSALGRIESLRK